MRDIENLVVHVIGQNTLRVMRLVQINTFVITFIVIVVAIGAMENHILGIGFWLGLIQQGAQGRTFPFADTTPAFNTIMTGNLSARWQRSQLRQ